ncbi:MAG: hypothetical protein WBA67_09325 [Jannaschia sp.]
MKTFYLAAIVAIGLAGAAAAQAPVRPGDFGAQFLGANPVCAGVVRWLNEGLGPQFRLPTNVRPAMVIFQLMEGNNRRLQPLVTDEALARLHPDGSALDTREALEVMSANVDACRRALSDQPGGSWIGSLAAGARDLAMFRQAERFFPDELAEATKGPGSGAFRSLSIAPDRLPTRTITAAERRANQVRLEAALDRSYLPEPIAGADQAAVMNGTADRLTADEVRRALVVEMQAGVPTEHLTMGGYRLMHPRFGMVGVNAIKSVDDVTCDVPTDGLSRCTFVVTTYTSFDPSVMNRVARNGEQITRLFNADGVTERVFPMEGAFRFKDRGWRVRLEGDALTRMIFGNPPDTGPYCPGIADSEVFFGCPPR